MKWISIDKRTPDHNEVVLCRTDEGAFVVAEYNALKKVFGLDFSAISIDNNGYDDHSTIGIDGKIVGWVRIL